MLSKKVTYTDFNGVKRNETLYFNLTKPELLRLEFEFEDGMSAVIERMVESENKREMLRFFETLLTNSYGEKSEDGRHFIKNDTVTSNFVNSAVYTTLFDELLQDESGAFAIEFFKGILPDLSEYGDSAPTVPPQRRKPVQ